MNKTARRHEAEQLVIDSWDFIKQLPDGIEKEQLTIRRRELSGPNLDQVPEPELPERIRALQTLLENSRTAVHRVMETSQ